MVDGHEDGIEDLRMEYKLALKYSIYSKSSLNALR